MSTCRVGEYWWGTGWRISSPGWTVCCLVSGDCAIGVAGGPECLFSF